MSTSTTGDGDPQDRPTDRDPLDDDAVDRAPRRTRHDHGEFDDADVVDEQRGSGADTGEGTYTDKDNG